MISDSTLDKGCVHDFCNWISATRIFPINLFGLEETRENYNPSDKIKDGYVPLYLTVDVPIQYDSFLFFYEPMNISLKI